MLAFLDVASKISDADSAAKPVHAPGANNVHAQIFKDTHKIINIGSFGRLSTSHRNKGE